MIEDDAIYPIFSVTSFSALLIITLMRGLLFDTKVFENTKMHYTLKTHYIKVWRRLL